MSDHPEQPNRLIHMAVQSVPFRQGMSVGILGAGQLGQMLTLAGYPLGLRFRFLDPTPDAPASHLAEQIVADYTDYAALERFAAGLDVVTYEFENVPVEAARWLAERVPVYPPPAALEVAQDRLAEKSFFRKLGIPTPPFAAVDSPADLQAAVASIGLPAVLKTRRFGYDGKGQFILREPADLDHAWAALGGTPLILEGYVNFDRELSVIMVSGLIAPTLAYPLVENHHLDGILRRSIAPAPELNKGLDEQAHEYASLVSHALGYIGVLAIELFQVGDQLLANEMAPRVHNSGHWTIEGAITSQFENHLRAILGQPLGAASPIGYSAMLNLIGTLPDAFAALAMPGAHLHLYGKQPRANRKLGHITICAADREVLERRLEQLQSVITPLDSSPVRNSALQLRQRPTRHLLTPFTHGGSPPEENNIERNKQYDQRLRRGKRRTFVLRGGRRGPPARPHSCGHRRQPDVEWTVRRVRQALPRGALRPARLRQERNGGWAVFRP